MFFIFTQDLDDMEADLFSLKKTSNKAPALTKPTTGGLKIDSTSVKSPEDPEATGNSLQTFPIISFILLPALNQMSPFYF